MGGVLKQGVETKLSSVRFRSLKAQIAVMSGEDRYGVSSCLIYVKKYGCCLIHTKYDMSTLASNATISLSFFALKL